MKRSSKGIIAATAGLMAMAVTTVMHYEGRELRAYQDIVGVWTICDGETKDVKPGDEATPAECDAMLAKNLVQYEAGLDRCLTAAVPGKTKVALLSWVYNVGIGAACKSTLVRLANAGRLREACDELLKWTRAGGRFVQGLANRREAERRDCIAGLAE